MWLLVSCLKTSYIFTKIILLPELHKCPSIAEWVLLFYSLPYFFLEPSVVIFCSSYTPHFI